MNKNIFDVNYTIGKNTLVEKGTITKIEINGEDVPVFKSDDRTKLGENVNIFYPNLIVDREKTIVKDGVFTLLYVNGHNIPLSGNSEGGTLYGYETGDGTIYYGTDDELHTGDTVYTADDGEIKEETVNDPDDFTRKEDEDVPYEGTEIEDLIPYGDGVDVVYTPTEDPKPGDTVFVATDDDKIEVGGTVTGVDEDGNIIVDGDKTYFMPRMIYTFTSSSYGGFYISYSENGEHFWGYKSTDYEGWWSKSISLPEDTYGVDLVRTPEKDIIYFGNEITDFYKVSSLANESSIIIAGVNSWDDVVDGTPIFKLIVSSTNSRIEQIDVTTDVKSRETIVGKSGKGYLNSPVLSNYSKSWYSFYDMYSPQYVHGCYAAGPNGRTSSAKIEVNDHFYYLANSGEINTSNNYRVKSTANTATLYNNYNVHGNGKTSVSDQILYQLYCFVSAGGQYAYLFDNPTTLDVDKPYAWCNGKIIISDGHLYSNNISTSNVNINMSGCSYIYPTKDYIPCIYKGDNKIEIDGVEYTYNSSGNVKFNYD